MASGAVAHGAVPPRQGEKSWTSPVERTRRRDDKKEDRSDRGGTRDAHRGRGDHGRIGACGPERSDRDRLGIRREGGDGAVRHVCARLAAQIRVKQVNARRGQRPAIRIATCDTQGNKPAIARACAAKLLSGRRTSSSRRATSSWRTGRPGGDQPRRPRRGACIGTDQMGPKRFGAKGRLAFSFGNVAQDEGSAMAEYAWSAAGGTRASRPTR